jgi:hypothetical protein
MGNELLKPKPLLFWMKWGIIFLCWTALALIFAGQSYINQALRTDTIHWKGPLVGELAWAYSWNLVTPLRYDEQSGEQTRSR